MVLQFEKFKVKFYTFLHLTNQTFIGVAHNHLRPNHLSTLDVGISMVETQDFHNLQVDRINNSFFYFLFHNLQVDRNFITTESIYLQHNTQFNFVFLIQILSLGFLLFMLLTQWLLQDSTLFILNIIIGYHRMEFKHFNFSKSCGTQHGRLEYFNMNKYDWIQWDNLHWILLNYIATNSLLVNTLLVLLFLREKDASLILGSLWTIQKGSMVLRLD